MLKKICSVLVTASLVLSQTAVFAQTQNTAETPGSVTVKAVSYTHLTLPTKLEV